ncbi:MAG: hypothetical protein ACFB0C_18225 [Leptolyngbyaceae cyanobacterium]
MPEPVENISPHAFQYLMLGVESELLRLGLNWQSERIKAWMARVEEATGHQCKIPADLSLKEVLALLDRLCETPSPPLVVGGDGDG